MNATTLQTGMTSPLNYVRAILIGLGLLLLAGSMPASAQTIYDADTVSKISGLTPQVRTQLTTITKASRAQLMATLAKFGIDPNAKPNSNMLMKASKELQAIQHAERQAVLALLKPEQMSQYDTAVAATTQRVREAMN